MVMENRFIRHVFSVVCVHHALIIIIMLHNGQPNLENATET